MKNIQVVRDLVKKALSKGEAVVNRNGDSVYGAKLADRVFKMWHYGTLILEYNMDTKNINKFGGYSATDRDALNNALDELGYDGGKGFRIKSGTLELV